MAESVDRIIVETITDDINSFQDIPKYEQRLYDILDDIDTAFDIFKPEESGFEKFVWNKLQEAKRIYTSDGYIVKRLHS